ncbi:hypothetical protein ACFWYW_55745 [Nonomuraea sp. NPDC059023]|uniref:hypothetical protein n=1 Tax=unclassified Nonomuraea TaxID=2593643 RepID=UPI0036BF1275
MILRRPWSSIRDWPKRYNARKLRVPGILGERPVYYDLADLATIESHLHRGETPPATPELRDAHRAQHQAA